MISYMPLAHMFERMMQVVDPLPDVFLFCLNLSNCLSLNPKRNLFLSQFTLYSYGAHVGFYQGDISLLLEDIKTLKPTFFPVVPRILNRIYDQVRRYIQNYCCCQHWECCHNYVSSFVFCFVFFWAFSRIPIKIMSSVSSSFQRALLLYAVRRKQAEVNRGIVRNNSLWDKLVFNKIQVSCWGLQLVLWITQWFALCLCSLFPHSNFSPSESNYIHSLRDEMIQKCITIIAIEALQGVLIDSSLLWPSHNFNLFFPLYKC